MEQRLKEFYRLIENEIKELKFGGDPKELYDPISYLMELGGKRMRPILSLLSYSLYKEDVEKVIKYAVAVEVFHNFTLMHDDIMDRAPIRRGKATVHEKWNDNIAILSGDVMFAKSFELFLDLKGETLSEVLRAFNTCAIKVCEGQQIDMNFESQETVTVAAYLEMIRLKTAVLLGFALELGAILGDASREDKKHLKTFGEHIGIGFQLKDDLLDVYADQEKFGKQTGGDIIANKKTYLLIKAMELANEEQLQDLHYWLDQIDFEPERKVSAVKNLYDELHIKALTEEKMNDYFQSGFSALEKLDLPVDKKAILKRFAEQLINREK